MVPSPHDLAYFAEVAQTLNISRAAERLGITQPSLTLAMQRLELAVGAPILIRSKRGVTLTQAGKQLQSHARLLFQSWDQIRAKALASMSDIEGSYTIGCHPSVALYTLSGFLPELLERHPRLDIRLKHDLSRKIGEGVVSSTVDIGVVVNPIRHPDVVIQKLCTDQVLLWRGPGKRSVQDPKSGRAVLICDPDLAQTQSLLKGLKKAGFEFSRTVASSSLEVIAELTASGCGIGILPTRVATLNGRLPLEPLSRSPVFLDEICLLYRVENRGVRSIQVIGDAITRHLTGARKR